MVEIIKQSEIGFNKALNLNPPDVYVCENCGKEMPVITGDNDQTDLCPLRQVHRYVRFLTIHQDAETMGK